MTFTRPLRKIGMQSCARGQPIKIPAWSDESASSSDNRKIRTGGKYLAQLRSLLTV